MKIEVESRNNKIENSFNKLMNELHAKSNGKIIFTWNKTGENSYLCEFNYPLENRIYNEIIFKTFKSTLEKIDSKSRIRKVKK